jgi:hypothetical protein
MDAKVSFSISNWCFDVMEISGNEISILLARLSAVIKIGLNDVRNLNLSIKKPNYSEPIVTPFVAIYEAGFQADEIGFGGELGEGRDKKELVLTGNGNTTAFHLPKSILKPLLQVRTKDSVLSEIDDYVVNYADSILSFRYAPRKNENVTVKYLVRRDGEDKGMRLKIRCVVDMWASDDLECSNMVLKALKQLLKASDELQLEGIRVLPHVSAERIDAPNSITGFEGADGKKDVHGKRLEYFCEVSFRVNKEPGFTRIRKIHIKEKKE